MPFLSEALYEEIAAVKSRPLEMRDEAGLENRVTSSPGRQAGSRRSQPSSRVASPSTKRQKMAPYVVGLITLSQKAERRQDGQSWRALATEPLGKVLRSAFRQEERQGVSGPGSALCN